MKFIPYGRQCIDDKDIEAVIEVLKSDFLTIGPKIKEFEDKLAAYVGAKYAVVISNGTLALHAACFATSSNAVLYCGGKPVFIDY